MEEKDIFDLDDRDLRLPRQYSSPRQVQSSMLINDSARYLGDAVIKGVTSFDKRMASIQASKDALTTFVTGLQEQATSLDNLDDNNVSDQIQKLLNEQIDEINLLGYNSIGRDQTEFIKRKSQLVSSTKNLLENMLNKDEQAADYQKVINSGSASNKISQLTPTINQEYLQDILLNNGRGSKVEYKDGAFIVTYTGKDGKTLTYNASNDINATKKGAKPLIQYVDDFDPSYKASYDRIISKYKPRLLQVTQTDDDGNTIVTKTAEYNLIRDQIIKELADDPNFAANASLDETQFLRGKGVEGIEEVYDIDLNNPNSLIDLNNKIKNQRASYIAGLYLPQDQETAKIVKPQEGDSDALKAAKLRARTADKQLQFEREKLALESGIGSDDVVSPENKYVDDRYSEISPAVDQNNQSALRNLIVREISSATGIDPQVKFDGDNLILTIDKPTGDKAYTPEQAKKINEAAKEAGGSDIIDSNGMIRDKEAFEALQEQKSFGPPTGKAIQEPSKTITINNYRTENGKAELLNALTRNRFTTAKNRSAALNRVEELRKRGETQALKEQRDKTTKETRQANIIKIDEDAMRLANLGADDIIKNGNLNEAQKQAPWLSQAMNFIKKLPGDFVINGPNGKVKAADYFKVDVAVEDMMFNYADLYKQIVADPSLAPNVSFTYTSIDNADRLDPYNLNE